jgi:hypothetical protein
MVLDKKLVKELTEELVSEFVDDKLELDKKLLDELELVKDLATVVLILAAVTASPAAFAGDGFDVVKLLLDEEKI